MQSSTIAPVLLECFKNNTTPSWSKDKATNTHLTLLRLDWAPVCYLTKRGTPREAEMSLKSRNDSCRTRVDSSNNSDIANKFSALNIRAYPHNSELEDLSVSMNPDSSQNLTSQAQVWERGVRGSAEDESDNDEFDE